ncbi:hypothetical protein LEP1GSC088_4603 [Leptospira interrogans str. L1207]|nr:hypothetical protein LEP1GSC088_4603 [Leptospira interrogans str. L1207]
MGSETFWKFSQTISIFYFWNVSSNCWFSFFAPQRVVDSEDSGVNIYSPIFAHKALIPLHLAAMLILPSLGQRIEKHGPEAARDMQQVGWAGFGAFTLSLFVITF